MTNDIAKVLRLSRVMRLSWGFGILVVLELI